MLYKFLVFLLAYCLHQAAHGSQPQTSKPRLVSYVARSTDRTFTEKAPQGWPETIQFIPSTYNDTSDDELLVVIQPSECLCIQPVPGKGLGVIATKLICRNTIIGEYTGQTLLMHDATSPTSTRQFRYAVSRGRIVGNETTNFIFSPKLGDQTQAQNYIPALTRELAAHIYRKHGNATCVRNPTEQETLENPYSLFLDAEFKGNHLRFCNHSSTNPNMHSGKHPNGKIYFQAIKTILPGDELLWDYGPGYWETLGIDPIE